MALVWFDSFNVRVLSLSERATELALVATVSLRKIAKMLKMYRSPADHSVRAAAMLQVRQPIVDIADRATGRGGAARRHTEWINELIYTSQHGDLERNVFHKTTSMYTSKQVSDV